MLISQYQMYISRLVHFRVSHSTLEPCLFTILDICMLGLREWPCAFMNQITVITLSLSGGSYGNSSNESPSGIYSIKLYVRMHHVNSFSLISVILLHDLDQGQTVTHDTPSVWSKYLEEEPERKKKEKDRMLWSLNCRLLTSKKLGYTSLSKQPL